MFLPDDPFQDVAHADVLEGVGEQRGDGVQLRGRGHRTHLDRPPGGGALCFSGLLLLHSLGEAEQEARPRDDDDTDAAFSFAVLYLRCQLRSWTLPG